MTKHAFLALTAAIPALATEIPPAIPDGPIEYSNISYDSTLECVMKDVTVTGNTNTTGYGAVNAVGGVGSLKLEGKVKIGLLNYGLRLHFGEDIAAPLDASGLAEGSEIYVVAQHQFTNASAYKNNPPGRTPGDFN